MSNYIITDLLEKIFDEVKVNNDQCKVNCPSCAKQYNNYESDGKFNLEINLTKKVYKCWKCSISGRLVNIFKYYGNPELHKFYLDNFDFSFDEFFVKEYEGDEENIFDVELPYEFIPFSEYNEFDPEHVAAYNYIVNDRKIEFKKILRLKMGFCIEGYYKHRIIIPSFDNKGKLNYFMSRSYMGLKPPYLNPQISKDIIINENMVDWNTTIYIVEGVMDSISLPLNTVILNGKVINDIILNNIKKFKPPVVIIIDGDALRDSLKLIDLLEANGIENIEFVYLEKEFDIDEIRKRFGKKYLSNYINENKKALTSIDRIWLDLKLL